MVWELSCTRAERVGAAGAAPLVLFGGVLTVLILLSGLGSPVAGPVKAWLGGPR